MAGVSVNTRTGKEASTHGWPRSSSERCDGAGVKPGTRAVRTLHHGGAVAEGGLGGAVQDGELAGREAGHRAIAGMMSFANRSSEPELERLASERRAATRRRSAV